MDKLNLCKYGFTVLQIESLSTCNMLCRFCAYPERTDKGNILSEKVVYKLIDSLEIDSKFEYICFSHFNEPLMDNRIYDFIGYAKKKSIPVLIITNGLLFRSKVVIEKLIKASPHNIKVSLQVLDAESFKQARGINSSFDDYKRGIIEFIKKASGGASKVVIDLACNFLSEPALVRAKLLGLEHGDPSVYNGINFLKEKMRIFLKEIQSNSERFAFDVDAFEEYIGNVIKDYSSQKEYRIDTSISIKVKPFFYGKRLAEFYPLKKGLGCSNRILGVLASGVVVPCCLAYGDLLSMGNVNTVSLKTVLENNAGFLKSIRQGTDSPILCRRCLGAPTKRGALLKDVRNAVMSMRKAMIR